MLMASLASGRPAAVEPRRASLERSQSVSANPTCVLVEIPRYYVLHALVTPCGPKLLRRRLEKSRLSTRCQPRRVTPLHCQTASTWKTVRLDG